MIYRANENKLIMGTKRIKVYEFDNTYNPNSSDDKPINAVVISTKNQEMYSAASCNIKVWSLIKFTISRVYKNISSTDISVMTLDETERKLFIGTYYGEVLYNNKKFKYIK